MINEKEFLLLILDKYIVNARAASFRRGSISQNILLSAALVGALIAPQMAQASRHFPLSLNPALLAAHQAKQGTKIASERVALAMSKAHTAQLARNVELRRKKLADVAQMRHQQQMAHLSAALHQQHLAQMEVRMQMTLTANAQRIALHQQKLALRQHKLQMAAMRHQGYARVAMLEAQHGTSPVGNAVMTAYALRGSRYVMGGTSRSGFDCSGFVRYVLSAADGVAVPRTASEQYYHGKAVAVQDMEPGDLVFFKNTYKHGISHVGIYAGQGKFIHAANSHKGVRIDILNSAYYWHHFAGARRVLPDQMRQAAFLR